MLKSRIDCIIMASYFNLCFIFVKLKPVFSVLRPFSPAIHIVFLYVSNVGGQNLLLTRALIIQWQTYIFI
ncbi:putative membrane protein [Proteiniphilum saccharofermentans]|uniref:Putative membrane protein n=1 Tax=Proteiniphilum saccharofermentans TaxID=1642647 RepID=A0A1R3T0Z8_9BACT|nr:putative membrane protein [Proteiniphilum saccharofermentans]